MYVGQEKYVSGLSFTFLFKAGFVLEVPYVAGTQLANIP